ncbi:TonB family protein [Cytophagaceae bacterium DM2B3-1]|uniref:TonB family protein n=1 Tax=Xanthocytophaga flava TaxID=3048013 RepID=A0ABT7CMT2_9BACT|nr:TonB family protein [Xanthocytophaga flavus]MDJ1495059.1 TonB family protein [Xanthocytophaga flavus]
MTRHKKNTPSLQSPLSQDIIEKYLFSKENNDISYPVESKLANDAFTADAVDGLGTQQSAQQMKGNMNDLKSRLHQRISQQKQKRGGISIPFGMQPYAIAASVALLLCCAVVVMFNVKYSEKTVPSLAKTQNGHPVVSPNETSSANAPEQSEIAMQQASSYKEPATTQGESKKSNKVEADKNVTKSFLTTNEKDKPVVVKSETVVESKGKNPVSTATVTMMAKEDQPVATSNQPVLLEEKMAVPPTESVQGNSFASVKPSADKSIIAGDESNALVKSKAKVIAGGVQTPRIVKGRVVDAEDGMAIPGTVVTVKGTNITTYTNQNGEYAITVPADGELAFSFVGYITYRIPVDQHGTINASLSPDMKSLSEVVVIGSEDEKSGKAAYTPAQPEKGMPEFMKTIEQKLEASPNAGSYGSGTIKIGFTVEPDGSLTNVKVLKSIGGESDQTAVQAVKDASRWTPAQENGKPVSQKMKIRIPLKNKKK